SFTHRGAVDSDPAVLTLAPPVASRRWNATPFDEETSTKACIDPGSTVSRIITPPFDHALAALIEVTRATIVPSPSSVVYAYWKASALPKRSAPRAVIVKVGLL